MSYPRLSTRTLRSASLSESDRLRMYSIFEKYYSGVTYAQFGADLAKKNAVILLIDPMLGEIQGFSTIMDLELEVGGRKVLGIFSGDTIVEKRYWGQGALAREFGKYLFKMKLRHPLRECYWFLISKGYKTYLLMTNNFHEHYPRYDRATPSDREEVLRAFAGRLFAREFDPASGLIRFGEDACRLKADVAPIDPELLRQNPRIAFFARINPEWRKGTELACLAKIDLLVPIRYNLKMISKLAKSLFGRREPRVVYRPLSAPRSRKRLAALPGTRSAG